MEMQFKMKSLFLFLFSVLSLATDCAWSAACCGGGFAAPAVIVGDNKAQLTTSYSFADVVVDNVDSLGIWRKWDEHQKVQTVKIEGAHIFADRWQAGFSLQTILRSRLGESYSGLGDLSTSVGYEYLPDWNYNPYRPKGTGYFQVILPTGKSRADSELGGLDSRGNGFFALGLGTFLSKSIRKWDVFSSLEVHRSLSKNISNSQITGTLKPGWGSNFSLGGGYNVKDYRFGSSISWTYEDPIDVEGPQGTSQGSIERYATAAFTVSYLWNDDWSGTINYSDQTLFGSPLNTSLGRGVALQLQRKWSR